MFLSEGANIICRWGSSDDVIGWVWGIPRFRDIPLRSKKVRGLGFLGFVTCGLLNL